MRTILLAAILIAALPIAFVTAACGGVDWFPKCADPKKPCPNVQPDYPPESPLARKEDAGRLDGGL